jgi:hypothetical protein
MTEDIDRLVSVARGWIEAAERIVVLTGAGISTDSGIPDFRGPQGVWTRNPEAEKQSTIQHYVADSDVRRRAWRSRLESPTWGARPNVGHQALVTLERRGKLHTLITQNIDGLHQAAGSSPERVVEVHGTMREVVCLSCGGRSPRSFRAWSSDYGPGRRPRGVDRRLVVVVQRTATASGGCGAPRWRKRPKPGCCCSLSWSSKTSPRSNVIQGRPWVLKPS